MGKQLFIITSIFLLLFGCGGDKNTNTSTLVYQPTIIEQKNSPNIGEKFTLSV